MSEKPWEWWQERLGKTLRRIRNEARLKNDFAMAPLELSPSMIRMIEAGRANIPAGKIRNYASILSSSADRGGPTINHQSLLDAYNAIRLMRSTENAGVNPEWKTLFGQTAEANNYLYDLLTGGGHDQGKLAESLIDLNGLNPIQLQLVSDIAKRVEMFGNDIVSDEAIANWESANITTIRQVMAAVTSLASELSEGFTNAIVKMVESKDFERLRYLIATDDANDARRAWSKFRRRICRRAESNVSSKFEFQVISREQFSELGNGISLSGNRWDAFYLYELSTGPSLMIGVFRRIPPLAYEVRQVKLADWGATPMNETLTWAQRTHFKEKFDLIWHPED